MHSQQYRSRRASRRHSNTSAVSQANGWGRGEGRECSWSADFANLRFLSSVVWCLLQPRLHSMYALAMLLDPRYKWCLFAPDGLEAIKQWAIDEARFEPSNPPANTPQPPPPKKATLARWTCSMPYWVHHAAPTSSASAASLVDAELSTYLQADVISRAESPTEWWAANAAKHPLLAAEAKCYLSAPPTSMASEHVFSAAGPVLGRSTRTNGFFPSVGKKSNKNHGRNLDFDFFDF